MEVGTKQHCSRCNTSKLERNHLICFPSFLPFETNLEESVQTTDRQNHNCSTNLANTAFSPRYHCKPNLASTKKQTFIKSFGRKTFIDKTKIFKTDAMENPCKQV